jgi:hypothetical protein
MVKMPKKPNKTPALVKRVAQQSKSKPLTREEQMDIAARKTAAEMDKINYDRSIEYRIMNERGGRFEPQPSERNSGSQAGGFPGINSDLTFSRAGARYGHTNYMRSRRVG